MTGAGQRPAGSLWQRAERERQLVRSVQEAEWRRRMLRAGNIDPTGLSDQALRILTWLDDWTVDGVIELMTAAHHAGRQTVGPASEQTRQQHAERPTPADAIKTRLSALREPRGTNLEVGL
jgi:hypothetical protein